MNRLPDLFHFLKKNFFFLIWILLACYFGYHTLYGERGYLRLQKLHEEKKEADAVLSEVERKKTEMREKISRMSPESIDPDMLDETARELLNMGRKDDLVILDKNP